ncbi:Cupredoxin [Leptodontidium sp. 2 PMI_412]|nr:Cupredoxin [Leptodontidium sp. 2 PMI_412]
MFGVEYGRECYCGDVLSAGSVKADNQADCKFLCPGDPLTYCGAGQRLQLYALGAVPSSSTSKPSSSVVSSKSSTAVSTAKPSSSTKSSSPTSSTFTKSTSTSKSASSPSSSALPYITPPAPKQVAYTWSVGWVQTSPDGFSRPMIGINGQFPCPPIKANMGDTIKITMTNNLRNQSTAIHFHGIFQTGTAYSDGPAMVTQCPIQPGGSFVYEFKVDQPGTYWYHAHIGGQYIDGLRGPLIINDVNAPYRGIDTEYTLTLSDLYHSEAPSLINYYQSTDNANQNNGAEPVPNSGLINEAQGVTFPMVSGKKYLFRIINMGAFAPFYLQFDQHDMTVVEIDGVYTKQTTVSQLFITVAQRYSVIITAKATSTKNFAIKASMSTDMFNPTIIPATFNTEVSAYLVYNSAAALPTPLTITPVPFDDSIFTPYDQKAAFGPVTMPIQMTISFGTNQNGQFRGYLNGIDYIPQKVPTLYTAMNAPLAQVNTPSIYGANTNSYVLPLGAVVELTLQNHDSFAHPFHLHGHNFQVISRTSGGPEFPINIPAGAPMRRDVVQVMSDGSVTIRFVADNPGIALFHCHIEWHVEAGLTATFIEAPTELQAAKIYIPVSHRDVCDVQGIPRKGNAAGNSNNYLDLTGANVVADTDMWG